MAILEMVETDTAPGPMAAVEEELRQRIALERLLITVSTRLINLPSTAIDAVLDGVLEQVGRAVGAEGSLVFLLSADRRTLVRRFGWIPPVPEGVGAPIDSLDVAAAPALMAAISALEPFRLDRVEELPLGRQRRARAPGGHGHALASRPPHRSPGRAAGTSDPGQLHPAPSLA